MTSVIGDDTNGLGFGVEGTSGAGIGMQGESKASIGVRGTSELGTGVLGRSKTSNGIVGESDGAIGVTGTSATGNGVVGLSKQSIGVVGRSTADNGVFGESAQSNGVMGKTVGAVGSGVFGYHGGKGNGVTGLSEHGFGVFGETRLQEQIKEELVAGVAGKTDGTGWGVLGLTSTKAGYARAAVGGLGTACTGVYGETDLAKRFGVHGANRSDSNADGVGVRGEGHCGVHGEGYVGIRGTSNASSYSMDAATTSAGVLGEQPLAGGTGVLGAAPAGIGVMGTSGLVFPMTNNAGVYGFCQNGPGVVGQSQNDSGILAIGSGSNAALSTLGKTALMGDMGVIGKVSVLGTLSATTKQFQIDHPLDPENKQLNHACVESSEHKTFYDGLTVLDQHGKATIKLPNWFSALNTNCHYQLTAIGSPAPNLHVSKELAQGSFDIAGGASGQKVCWQVTGVRQDPAALANPVVVEGDKIAAERGTYLSPEAYGLGEERGVLHARYPQLSTTRTALAKKSDSR